MAAVTLGATLISSLIGVKQYQLARSSAKASAAATKKAEKTRTAELEAERIKKEAAEKKAAVRGLTTGYTPGGQFTRSAFLSTLGMSSGRTGFSSDDAGMNKTTVFRN